LDKKTFGTLNRMTVNAQGNKQVDYEWTN
jgi:hypothetical protein